MSSYWCHQCQACIHPALPDVSCPTCHSEFIEEIENPTQTTQNPPLQPQPQPQPQTFPQATPFPFAFGFPNFVHNFNMAPNPNIQTQPMFNAQTATSGSFTFPPSTPTGQTSMNPFEILQQSMLNLRGFNAQNTTNTPNVIPNPNIQTQPSFNPQPTTTTGGFNAFPPSPNTQPQPQATSPNTPHTSFSPHPRVQVSVQTFPNATNPPTEPQPHQLPRQNFFFQQQNLAGRNNPFLNLLQQVLQNGNQAGTFTFGIARGDASMNMGPMPNFGDYAFGNMDQILNQLFQQTGRRGPPPASKEEVKKLKKEKVINKPGEPVETCPVCSEEFSPDEDATFMPCEHCFHAECIEHWLDINNNCPICRYELKTDDPEYEARKAHISQSSPPHTSQTHTSQTHTTTITNEINENNYNTHNIYNDINNNNSNTNTHIPNTENENFTTQTTAPPFTNTNLESTNTLPPNTNTPSNTSNTNTNTSSPTSESMDFQFTPTSNDNNGDENHTSK